jgi:antitoxin (DNA-binding transcriptional repressor) of toxin-antitoxin stability system
MDQEGDAGSGRRRQVDHLSMKRATIRELHLQTSAIVRAVAEGESYVIERLGVPVAEVKPLERLPSARKLPNRERLISKIPRVEDSGRVVEEDRS